MVEIDQSGLAGKIRDRPISKELEVVLQRAGSAAGVDKIFITSGGQPGTTGKSTDSTRHNGGRAADLQLLVNGKVQTFSDSQASRTVTKFVTAAAAHGATGIGAGVGYMGPATLHIGFGLNVADRSKLTWGAQGRSANAPAWLRQAADAGWNNPPAWAFATDDNFTQDLPEDQDETHEVILDPWRLHDLRRTGTTNMQRLRISIEVTERVINHHQGGEAAGVRGIYNLYEYQHEKTLALQAWADWLHNLVSGQVPGTNVVPLATARV